MMSPYYDERIEHDTEKLHAKEDFLKSITRGGLLEPSDMLYVICCHGWTLFAELSQQERNKILLLSFHYPRASFVEVFLRTLENESNTKDLLATECVNNHPFKRHIKVIAETLFNIFAKNLTAEANSKIHKSRKRNVVDHKKSQCSRKLKKLSS